MSPEVQSVILAAALAGIGWLLLQSFATRRDMAEGDKKLQRLADALSGFDGEGGILAEQRRHAVQLDALSVQIAQLALLHVTPPAPSKRRSAA